MTERITDPITVPASLWQRADTTDALRSWDVRRLFHLLRQYAGASQTRLGTACGLTQGKVSEIMSGAHRVTTLEVFERIADGLRMPPSRISLSATNSHARSINRMAEPISRPLRGKPLVRNQRTLAPFQDRHDHHPRVAAARPRTRKRRRQLAGAPAGPP